MEEPAFRTGQTLVELWRAEPIVKWKATGGQCRQLREIDCATRTVRLIDSWAWRLQKWERLLIMPNDRRFPRFQSRRRKPFAICFFEVFEIRTLLVFKWCESWGFNPAIIASACRVKQHSEVWPSRAIRLILDIQNRVDLNLRPNRIVVSAKSS